MRRDASLESCQPRRTVGGWWSNPVGALALIGAVTQGLSTNALACPACRAIPPSTAFDRPEPDHRTSVIMESQSVLLKCENGPGMGGEGAPECRVVARYVLRNPSQAEQSLNLGVAARSVERIAVRFGGVQIPITAVRGDSSATSRLPGAVFESRRFAEGERRRMVAQLVRFGVSIGPEARGELILEGTAKLALQTDLSSSNRMPIVRRHPVLSSPHWLDQQLVVHHDFWYY